jgi:hypothetical protein
VHHVEDDLGDPVSDLGQTDWPCNPNRSLLDCSQLINIDVNQEARDGRAQKASACAQEG